MTSSLVWRPARVVEASGYFSTELKFALKNRMEGNSLILDHSDIQYLEGLNDAGIADAKELIKLIHKHERIELWLEY